MARWTSWTNRSSARVHREGTASSRRELQGGSPSWQPPNLHSFGGETMTLALWKDYVASYLSDAMGGRGVAYVTSLEFGRGGELQARSLLST